MLHLIIKSLIISILLLLQVFSVQGQTLLATGDIAFVGYQSGFVGTPTPKDRFAFVLLKAVETDTRIIFNDNAVLSTNPVRFCKNESQAIWRSTSSLPVGTVVVITESDSMATFGKVSGSIALAQAGDQIIGMQANGADTTLLAGISHTTWATSCATSCGGPNNNFTCLPPPLVNGNNAITLNSTITNSFLNVSQLTGTASEILATVNNASNWTLSNNEQEWTSGYWQFSVLTSVSKKAESNFSSSVVPNPSQGKFSIKSKVEWSRATISNALGTKILEISNTNESIFDLTELPTGMYFVQVFSSTNKILSVSRWVKK